MSESPNPPPGTTRQSVTLGEHLAHSAPAKRVNGLVRIRFFTDRYDWMGPVIVVLSSWYFAAQVLVAWVFRPHYSEFSFSQHRRESAAAIAGFACLALGGLGAILVGVVPENVNTAHLHTVGTAMAIGFGQLAILILGLVLREVENWLREFMLVTSLVVLLAGIAIAGKHQFGIGGGALERLAQYPESVWLIIFGFYISRNHYRTGVTGSRFRFCGDLRAKKGTFRWALGKSVRLARGTAPASPPKLAGE